MRLSMNLQFVLVLIPITAFADNCMVPKPAANFDYEKYLGTWYEIGRVQTAGGARWQKDCYCTNMVVKPSEKEPSTKDAITVNGCNWGSSTGDLQSATGSMYYDGHPGHWKLSFFWFLPYVDFTVLILEDDYAVTYDCSKTWWGTVNYCIHILSRKPIQDPEVTQKILKEALDLGLNPQNIDYVSTPQDGCWEEISSKGNPKPEL
ncbi:apolipoprotein D-like [Ptychodera flava]|uniref:apolipoprotein D-like n=1 Tax=Ptychodera flava TaxID=63121 RepID=UPI00396A8B2F